MAPTSLFRIDGSSVLNLDVPCFDKRALPAPKWYAPYSQLHGKVRTLFEFREHTFKHQELIELFLVAELPISAAVDLLGSFNRTAPKNIFILIIADRLSEVTICIPLWSTTAATATAEVLEYSICVYGAP